MDDLKRIKFSVFEHGQYRLIISQIEIELYFFLFGVRLGVLLGVVLLGVFCLGVGNLGEFFLNILLEL